ncbi:hypothetical protein D9M68_666210 [compost metagenome]
MGKTQQRLGPGILQIWLVIEEQPSRQRVVFGGDQGHARQHGLRLPGCYGHGFGLADIRQADKTDALRVLADRIGQPFAGLEASGMGRQVFAVGAQHQFLEGVVGTGIVVAGVQVDRPTCATQLCPVL